MGLKWFGCPGLEHHKLIRMIKIGFLIIIFILLSQNYVIGQVYDILLKNGTVVDPRSQTNDNLDVAIINGKISKIERSIPVADAKKVIDVSGLYVCPGFIDLHTHVFVGSKADTFADGILSVSPDDFTFKSAVTTVVDAGTSGWRSFPVFKEQVIDRSKTRVLAFVNICGSGMVGKPAQENIEDMSVAETARAVREYKDYIVGVKIGHYEGKDWTPFERAVAAASQSVVPLFVECHLPEYPLIDQLQRMRPGDIITHSYEKVSERMSVVDEHGKVRTFVMDAKNRGILFDLGHGGAGFWFSEAIPALKQGLSPNTFGTDLHRFSMNAGMKDLLNVMSKYMAMGMSFEDVVRRVSWNAATAIKRNDLGTLTENGVADIAVVRLREGHYGFIDAGGNRIEGKIKLEAEMTISDGKIVWDLNGLSATPYK